MLQLLMDQKTVLTSARLTLNPAIKEGKRRGEMRILKSVPHRTYLTIDDMQSQPSHKG